MHRGLNFTPYVSQALFVSKVKKLTLSIGFFLAEPKDLIMFSILSMFNMSEGVKEMENNEKEETEEKRHERVIVKGYMRPDGTSYYVVIPKEIRELLGLRGGEYFVMKAKPEKHEIKLKIAKFVEEGQP